MRRDAARQLRTPVTAPLSQAELALRRAQPEREKESAGKIERDAEKIARSTRPLLRLSRAEAIPLSAASHMRADLPKITAQRARSFNEVHPSPRIELNLQTTPVRRIALSIAERIDKLPGNARSYASNRGPMPLRAHADQEHARLEVIDAGPGIAEEHRKKALDRLSRPSEAGPGFGLGLATAKESAQTYGDALKITHSRAASARSFAAGFR